MTKAFSILHRAAALLVALCLLVGMALPVYAAEDGALFFDAGSETIPTIPAADTSSEGVEPAQEPIVSDLETIPNEGDTPPTANEPGTEAGDTVNNAAAVPNNDGKTQEAAENQTPAADTDTAPADPALTNNPPADTSDTAAAPNHAINAEETTAAKTNTEQDVLFADGDNPNEEDTMPADDLPDNDDANTPDTIADTSVSTGFIPTTANIYFAVDNTIFRDSYRVHLYAHKLDDSGLDKDMVDTGTTTTDGRKIYRVTLNQADYSAGGFYRLIFQYFDGTVFKDQFFAFGGESGDDNGNGFKKETAIDKIAGQMFDGGYSFDTGKNGNQGKAFNPDQWTRVEYYYKDTPLYFKNASNADLANVTAVFYKKGTDGTVETTASLPIGTVEAGKFYAQKIPIPDNKSQFVKFTWDNGGESDLYNFSTDKYEGATSFNLIKNNCFVYSTDSPSSWQSADSDLLTGGKIIYFDATLSSYGYDNEGLQQQPMPGNDKKMYCFLTDSDDNVTWQEMKSEEQGTDSTTPDRQLWSCQIPNDGKTYTAVQFSAVNDQGPTAQDNKTKVYTTAEIPPTLQEPCFFADDGDPSAYTSSNDDVFREGYWGEKKSRHNAESGKSLTVVDIDNSGSFTRQAGTKYITSTLYDYYTDYELNGLNRDIAPNIGPGSQRGFVTFEQFDRALSSAYSKSDNVKYPLYTGHFEPTGGNAPFSTVAGGMKLCGWGDPNGDLDQKALYNTFMAVNNSTYDDKGKKIDNDYSRTFQGLVEKKTSANGLPLLRTVNSDIATALVDPHFDEDFLQGKNSFNTVLGKVYKDVSFPFTKDAVFKSGDTSDPEQYAKYWYYDSSKASLYLKQDQTNGKYYLEFPGKDSEGKPITDDKSRNISPSGPASGFFPFNQTVSTGGVASQYNYGFGAKLQFDFTLTQNGKVVVGKDDNDEDIEVPIKFFFSGDDDVWVYIDGELVLDVGGAHGKASGLLEFGENNTVTPYVSSNKNTTPQDGTIVYQTYEGAQKSVYFNEKLITFKNKGNPIPLNPDLTTHTLTMFYMERGMWDSNMAVAFNFPDSNELQVEKEVDLTNVNDKFKPLFKDQKLFTFTLQNLATHYGAKPIVDNDTPTPVPVGDAFNASSPTVHTTMKKDEVPPGDGETYRNQTVKWYAQGNDIGSEHRDLRYGTMTLDPQLDISKTPDYLSFDVYAEEKPGDGVLSTNYLYLTLVDSNNKQKGCDLTDNDTKSHLNTMLSGSVVMKNKQWVTVKLQLNKMPQDEDFNLGAIKKILIGDDYEREVYFRNFVFTAKPVVNRTVGFSVEQKDIPDYGSVENKTLMPAGGAIFTSSVASNGTQAVDTDGTFDLQAGETVTFTDQFRRGSYISLQETENTALYDTRWEVYENGTLVNAAGTSPSVSGTPTFPLQGDNTNPEDNRTETADSTTGSNYNGSKPTGTNTLVFRSYAAPEEEFPELKVKFINTVKVGTLVIEKKQADDGSHLTGEYTFTVTFSNVGGIGLGGADGVTMTKTLKVDESCEITGIPIGTRFQVVEETPAVGSLQRVTCTDTNAQYNVVDNGVRGTVTSENPDVTATFTNTARQLMDIEVEKQWLDAKGSPLTDNLPKAIWVKLQRHHVDDTTDNWQDAPTDPVELKYNYLTGKWTEKFERLDKTDVNDNNIPYEYRVVESASGTGNWYGGTDGDVIEISGKKYKVLNTSRVTGDSTDKTLTLTNQLQDAKYKLVITKLDAQEVTKKLDGVAFKLEKLKADNTAEITYNGTTGRDGAETGELTFADLSPGKYRLTETKTAAGYTLLSEAIEFTLTTDGKCQRSNGESIAVTPDTAPGVYNIALTIYNRKGFTLPHTGADAPSLWLLIGLPALVAVLLVLVFRYNKKGGRRS